MLHHDKNFDTKQATEKAAVTLQKYIRSWKARMNYSFFQLPIENQADCHAFLIGNDPVIEKLNEYKSEKDQIAIVATSCMRVLLLACELMNNTNKRSVPKIFIVDNSRQVNQLWKMIKEIASKHHQQNHFMLALNDFVTSQKDIVYMDLTDDMFLPPFVKTDIKYPSQNIIEYFKNLFNNHGFECIRSMILCTSFISQSWEDEDTFLKIKNILNLLKIEDVYVYASNIIHCVPKELRMPIIKNISLLQANLSIHTDLSKTNLSPEIVFYLKDQDVENVYRKLGF